MFDSDSESTRFSLIEFDDAPALPANGDDIATGLCGLFASIGDHARAMPAAPAAAPVELTALAVGPAVPTRAQARAAAQAATVAAPAVTAQAVEADQVIAVESADQTTGAVIYWQLSGDVEADKLRAAWLAEGLDVKLLPEICSPDVALSRAVKEVSARSVLPRKHPKGGYQMVRETAVNHELDYSKGERVYLRLNARDTIDVEAAPGQDQALAEATAVLVRAEYARQRAQLSGADVSAWLVKLADKLQAVGLRERGGIYFVPRDTMERFRAAKRALQSVSANVVHEIPALRSAEAIAAILDAIIRESEAAMLEIGAELATEIGIRAARHRLAEVDALHSKVESYERLLGRSLGDTRAKLATLRSRLASVQTRTSQLEIA